MNEGMAAAKPGNASRGRDPNQDPCRATDTHLFEAQVYTVSNNNISVMYLVDSGSLHGNYIAYRFVEHSKPMRGLREPMSLYTASLVRQRQV